MVVSDIRPLLAPASSLLCAIMIFIVGHNAFQRRLWSITASVAKFVIVASMLPGSLRGVIYVTRLIPFSHQIRIELRADALGMFFAMVSSTLWLVTTVYAIGYMEGEHARQRFFAFFAVCVSTTVGIAFAGNLFTLFIFYEMLTIATYPLVIHEETPEAMKAGRKYLIYTLTGGAVLLFTITITFYLVGTTTLSRNGILSINNGVTVLYALFAAYIFSFGVKAAIMPLHGWLPSAMVAPTPVSALLHAVAVVKAGVFGIIRVIYNVFGIDLMRKLGVGEILAYFVCITIIGGSIMAILQDNLKRRLAYSTVSQLSYIVLGAALLTPSAVIGGVVHIANQAFMKITLFFCAGAIDKKTGWQNVSEMDGVGMKMPITMAAFTIASLGMMGLPPIAGFITKWYLSLGALQAHDPIFVVVLMISSLLNAVYWLPIIFAAYFKKPQDGDERKSEAHWTLLGPIIVTAAYSIALGLLAEVPGLPLSLARRAATMFLKG